MLCMNLVFDLVECAKPVPQIVVVHIGLRTPSSSPTLLFLWPCNLHCIVAPVRQFSILGAAGARTQGLVRVVYISKP